MKQSRVLTNLSRNFCPEVLTNPQSVLGPKWEDVLTFWEELDTLLDRQRCDIHESYQNIDEDGRIEIEDVAWDAACDKIGDDFANACYSASLNVHRMFVFGYATWEIIGGVDNKIIHNIIMRHKNR
jgi:hypothetical protein